MMRLPFFIYRLELKQLKLIKVHNINSILVELWSLLTKICNTLCAKVINVKTFHY